jgi:3-deoxy-D-manno-octulosonate 8-phosphate phosphatase (KDO 8-P phosphatase)
MSEIELERRAARIKILLMDCDGVLTDGRITLLHDGDELKSFHTRDGNGLVLLHRAGLKSGIISGRTAKAVERRARDLGISYVYQGILDKIATFNELTSSEALDDSEIAYIGDDVTDVPLMNRVGLAVAVADAVTETKAAAHYTTELAGGFGAVREVCELILKAQGHWNGLMNRYLK